MSVLLSPALALFLLRKMKAPAAAAIAMAPTAAPTPMPAFAPVERPLGGGVEEEVTVAVMTLDAVGVETDVSVAVARPSVAFEEFENQPSSVVKAPIRGGELTGPPCLVVGI